MIPDDEVKEKIKAIDVNWRKLLEIVKLTYIAERIGIPADLPQCEVKVLIYGDEYTERRVSRQSNLSSAIIEMIKAQKGFRFRVTVH